MTGFSGNIGDIDEIFRIVEREDIGRLCIYHLVYSGRGAYLSGIDVPNEEKRVFMDKLIRQTDKWNKEGREIEVMTVDNHADGPFIYLWLLENDPSRAEAAYDLVMKNGGNRTGVAIGAIDSFGFVHPDQFTQHHIVGNIRERKFSEIWTDPHVALLFLIPGVGETLRVNGRAAISIDPALLERPRLLVPHERGGLEAERAHGLVGIAPAPDFVLRMWEEAPEAAKQALWGRSLSELTIGDAIRVGDLKLPAGYSLQFSGQYEDQIHARKRLQVVVPLVLVIIFVILYFTFHSAKEATLVMLSVPFALIGGVWLMWLLGYNMSVAVAVGFLALAGVAAETGVVMLIYLDHAWAEARERRQRAP